MCSVRSEHFRLLFFNSFCYRNSQTQSTRKSNRSNFNRDNNCPCSDLTFVLRHIDASFSFNVRVKYILSDSKARTLMQKESRQQLDWNKVLKCIFLGKGQNVQESCRIK